MANLFWLLAAFRPERDPELTQLFNDLAWVTFTSQVGFLIAQSVILALAIYLDRQDATGLQAAGWRTSISSSPSRWSRRRSRRWRSTGPLAWDGLLSFWVKNVAIGLWIVVMGSRSRPGDPAPAGRRRGVAA